MIRRDSVLEKTDGVFAIIVPNCIGVDTMLALMANTSIRKLSSMIPTKNWIVYDHRSDKGTVTHMRPIIERIKQRINQKVKPGSVIITPSFKVTEELGLLPVAALCPSYDWWYASVTQVTPVTREMKLNYEACFTKSLYLSENVTDLTMHLNDILILLG